MITFFVCLIALILGYVFYSKFVEKTFGADDSIKTPAIRLEDGVDYVPLPTWRIFLIQFLNIAGLGPIFGAIAGALWGPVAFIWIVLGTIFAGGVHDYFSGMLSTRSDGASIPEVVGKYLGPALKVFMRFFSVVVLVLVGVVFVAGPAGLLQGITPISQSIWLYVIFAYYIVATMVPIDKLIGKIYPIFGIVLLIMAIGVIGGILFGGYTIPEMKLANMRPDGLPIWPFLCITIACGAISGFHSTQSPLMARCITSEKQGRRVFYGAMVAEGVVALIWAAAAMSFFGSTSALSDAMNAHGGAAYVVNVISNTLLGKIGGILAILGVVACPITSGDTSFRSARLTIADALHFNQEPIKNRFIISIPLFVIGFILTRIDFSVLWRYFAWSNQTLAMVVLWAAAGFLVVNKRNFWIAIIPAIYMSAVTSVYILEAPEGLKLPSTIAYPIGAVITIIFLLLFISHMKKSEKGVDIANN
ncbi:MAG: carbon starvation protein A [Clostridia bacterium]|jgi:carbon starvation protein CstA|nr:carbon starvation protein A [Clostridia bacterium]MCI2000544.1 carbon starvation protein A [Clostridia bacterium]MCI2014999.1 carbon starvation protein A [Clostridia bacterium]